APGLTRLYLRVPRALDDAAAPELELEPELDEHVRLARPRHQRRPRLHEVGILARVGEALDLHARAAHLAGDVLQERERGDDLERRARGPRSGRRRRHDGTREQEDRRDERNRDHGAASYLLTQYGSAGWLPNTELSSTNALSSPSRLAMSLFECSTPTRKRRNSVV